jgi:hypothetical protein
MGCLPVQRSYYLLTFIFYISPWVWMTLFFETCLYNPTDFISFMLQPWRWRQSILLKIRYQPIRLQGIATQRTTALINQLVVNILKPFTGKKMAVITVLYHPRCLIRDYRPNILSFPSSLVSFYPLHLFLSLCLSLYTDLLCLLTQTARGSYFNFFNQTQS